LIVCRDRLDFNDVQAPFSAQTREFTRGFLDRPRHVEISADFNQKRDAKTRAK